jgi:hypothetical protein
MPTFQPRLDILPPPQALWAQLDATPDHSRCTRESRWRCGWEIVSRSISISFRASLSTAALASEIPYVAGPSRCRVVNHSL